MKMMPMKHIKEMEPRKRWRTKMKTLYFKSKSNGINLQGFIVKVVKFSMSPFTLFLAKRAATPTHAQRVTKQKR